MSDILDIVAAAAAVSSEEEEAARKAMLKDFAERASDIADKVFTLGGYATAMPLFQVALGFHLDRKIMRRACNCDRDAAVYRPELIGIEKQLDDEASASTWFTAARYQFAIGDLARAEVACHRALKRAKSKRAKKSEKDLKDPIREWLDKIAQVRALVTKDLPALHAEAVSQMGAAAIQPLPESLAAISL